MRKATVVGVVLLLVVVTASAQDSVARWKQIKGIVQAGNVVGSGTGAVAGGGQPWTTTVGVAHANLATGQVQFVVRGLVFAGGNAIGTRDGISAVRAILVCDTNGSAGGGNSVVVQGPAVALDGQGNAHFSGDVGTLPAVCSSEPDIAFLIRVAAVNGVAVNGPWIAFGAVLQR